MNNGFGVSPLEIMATDAILQGLAWCDEFAYSAAYIIGTPTALGSLATIDVQILINGDSDFVVQEANITAFDNANPPVLVPDPNLLMTLIRGGSGREVMNQPQHVLNMLGGFASNKQQGRVPFCALLGNSQILTVKLQNLSTTVFSRVDVAFRGFKVFYLQTQTQQGPVTGNRQMIFHVM